MENKISENSCRCCMEVKDITEMIHIFNCSSTLNVYTDITKIEANEDDGLPNYICNKCQIKLNQFHRFRSMCLNSNEKFRGFIFIKLEEQIKLTKDDEIKVKAANISKKTRSKNEISVGTSNSSLIKEEVNKSDNTNESKEYNEDYNDNDQNDDEDNTKNVDIRKTRLQSNHAVKKTKSLKKPNSIKNNTSKSKMKRDLAPNEKGSKAVFPCTLCDRKFFRERRFEGHLRQHQGLKPAKCKLCDKEFAKWGGLDTHIMYAHNNLEKKFICEEPNCGKSYMMKQSLVTHQKRTHVKNPERKTTCNYICEQCGKSFSSTGTLKKHTFVHTGLMPFKCLLCPRKYVTKHKLKEHMMRHDGIKNYVCPVCGLGKTTMHELKVHINYHTREKLYPCKVCPSVFTSIGNRGRHVKIVHCGIKAYPCTHCDRSFGKAETLKHHIMTHTGEKPHGCNVCGKRFIQSVALQTHLKTHKKV